MATREQDLGAVPWAAEFELADLLRKRRALLSSSARTLVRLRRTLEAHRAELEAAQARLDRRARSR
jgi:hypothetical protein